MGKPRRQGIHSVVKLPKVTVLECEQDGAMTQREDVIKQHAALHQSGCSVMLNSQQLEVTMHEKVASGNLGSPVCHQACR